MNCCLAITLSYKLSEPERLPTYVPSWPESEVAPAIFTVLKPSALGSFHPSPNGPEPTSPLYALGKNLSAN
jgi:hypothetical protein